MALTKIRQEQGVVINEGSTDVDFRVESNGNANMLFVDGGANHVSIGTATDNGGVLNVSSTDNTDTLVVYSSDADANAGPIIRLWRNSSSPADNDGIGAILFSGEDDADAKTDYASIESFALDVTNGTEDGELTIYTVLAGAKVNRLDFNSTETIFNSPGADLDFRVESDAHTHALFVQGSDGNVGIDQSSPAYLLDVGNSSSSPASGNVMRINSSGDTIFSLSRADTSYFSMRNNGASYVALASNNSVDLLLGYSADGAGAIADHLRFSATATVFNEASADRDFRVESDANTHAFFLNGGDGLISFGGAATSLTTGTSFVAGDNYALYSGVDGTGTKNHCVFGNANGYIGSIKTNGSATSFNTSSDYRLKENVDYSWDATTRLKQLKPARFNFIVDDTNTLVDGFMAHEVSSIVPEAITGAKDAVDSDNNPEYQGIDQSKLVPLLVKTIQELEARITALE